MFSKKYFIWLIRMGWLLIFLVAIIFISQNILKEEKFWRSEIKKIKIGKNIFQAEIAATPAKRNRGLSDRNNLCENCAILFLFAEKGQYSFWMKEMNFDLDIIWIDNNEIVHIAKNISHKREQELIKPDREADKVLEINAGLTDKLEIEIGDKVEF